MWGYDKAFCVERDSWKSGRKPEEYALHSLRMGGASMVAAGGDLSERIIQREGRWTSYAYKV